ncbi:MAG TPA: hypothetical protein VIC62_17910 [Nakamurella sp.]
MTVLVVGATRVLRPAVLELIAGGEPVLAVARTAADLVALAGTSTLISIARADGHESGTLRAELAAAPTCDAAIAYQPAVGDLDSLAIVRGAVAGPIVLLRTSSAADTGDEEFGPADLGPTLQGVVNVVLGWHRDGGRTRWHTPEEISASALQALHGRTDRILGAVRPWSDRPA